MNLEEIFNEVAKEQQILNYVVSFNSIPSKTEGFLSELYFGEIKNEDNKEKLSIIVKNSPKEAGIFVNLPQLFENENYFYGRIMQELNKFQNNQIDPIPRYFFGNSKYIVMENVIPKGYTVYKKSHFFDRKYLELLFKLFAKFHALSFAYKDEHSQAYNNLVKNIIDPFKDNNQRDILYESIATNVVAGFEVCDSVQGEKFKKRENVKEILLDLVDYQGSYKCFIHGDSWSNNFLFKYGDSGVPIDAKIVDFQMARESSPIQDLGFLFYSGAGEVELTNLDFYLELYYRSFSSFSLSLGSDPEKLLPEKSLKSEWKNYGLFGAFLSFDLLVLKLIKPEKTLEFRNTEEGNKEKGVQMWDEEFERIRTTEEFKLRSRVVIEACIQHGIL